MRYVFQMVAIAAALWPVSAAAHVGLEKGEATIGSSYKAVFKIPHGCEKSPTTTVRIDIPEGIIGVKPMPKAGWTLASERGAYAKTYDYMHGAKLSEGVKNVTWSGGRLLDDQYDEFVLATSIAKGLTAGVVYFNVTQTCETGSLAWTEIPAGGQDAHDLKHPAVGLRLVGDGATLDKVSKVKAGDLTIESAWTRATPGKASVGAGYVKITNTGSAPDRLIGGVLGSGERVEVHDMTMTDGIMRMRQLTEGLEIKPGETVELKPGGMHLMFVGLKDAFKEGETIERTLTFEKAGAVDVPFDVAPIGAQAPAGAADAHKHHH